jgi:sugar O-acyltransferase (sialic acid O-acetyltransferase NeuD family)
LHPIPSNVVIFGLGQLSSLAWYCLTNDSALEVVAFTADGAYLDRAEHHGLPVVPFESLIETHPPDAVSLLIPIGFRDVNRLRQRRYAAGKALGYGFATYISSRASTWPDLEVGENTLIYEHAIVQPFVRIGANTIIRSGVHLSHHVRIGDHCFLASEAALGGGTVVEERCFLGMNSTIRDGVTLSPGCIIAAGAVVLKDTEANGVYTGSPAQKRAVPADRMKLA